MISGLVISFTASANNPAMLDVYIGFDSASYGSGTKTYSTRHDPQEIVHIHLTEGRTGHFTSRSYRHNPMDESFIGPLFAYRRHTPPEIQETNLGISVKLISDDTAEVQFEGIWLDHQRNGSSNQLGLDQTTIVPLRQWVQFGVVLSNQPFSTSSLSATTRTNSHKVLWVYIDPIKAP